MDITQKGERYRIPHDDLVDWVIGNLNALNTESWQVKGLYHWPHA